MKQKIISPSVCIYIMAAGRLASLNKDNKQTNKQYLLQHHTTTQQKKAVYILTLLKLAPAADAI
jgi:hypothetical protein